MFGGAFAAWMGMTYAGIDYWWALLLAPLALLALVAALSTTRRDVILVSNEVGQGIVPATASGRLYRDELGRLNTRVAAAVDEVWFCTAGVARRLR